MCAKRACANGDPWAARVANSVTHAKSELHIRQALGILYTARRTREKVCGAKVKIVSICGVNCRKSKTRTHARCVRHQGIARRNQECVTHDWRVSVAKPISTHQIHNLRARNVSIAIYCFVLLLNSSLSCRKNSLLTWARFDCLSGFSAIMYWMSSSGRRFLRIQMV